MKRNADGGPASVLGLAASLLNDTAQHGTQQGD